jgi:type IV pilus assembly protein PilO
MSISPRDRLIVTIALAALIVIALIAVLVYPQFQKLGTLNAQLAEATAQADRAKGQLLVRQAFKDRAVETNAKWLRLMNQVPDNPDLPSFIIELQDVAFKSGVQVVAVTPTQPSANGEFSSIPVSLEILGTWSDTVDYLEATMKLDRGVRLTGVETKTTASGTDDKRNASLPAYAVDTVVTLQAYLIPSTTATATPGAAPTQ